MYLCYFIFYKDDISNLPQNLLKIMYKYVYLNKFNK